jgi:hypothetical protein
MGEKRLSCPDCRSRLVPVSYEPDPEETDESDPALGALASQGRVPTHYCRRCQRAVRMGGGSVERS